MRASNAEIHIAARPTGNFGKLVGFILRVARVRGAGIGMAIIVLTVAAAVAAPMVAPDDPKAVDVNALLAGPSLHHPLGTDILGRDLLSRLIFGARVSLLVGLMSVGVAAGIGVPIGLIAGYAGGAIEAVLMRIIDGIIAFPVLILALALVAVLGSSLTNVMLAIGVAVMPTYARVTRAEALSLKSRDFILSARASGAGPVRIVLRHILPNTIPPLLVVATVGFAGAVIAEAALSFLGLGVAPPTPTWGNLLYDGFQVLRLKPMIAIAPGTAIFVLVLSFNFVGDALRDVLDPRLRGTV